MYCAAVRKEQRCDARLLEDCPYHESKQRAVAVDEKAVLGVAGILQGFQNFVQVVHSALDRGTHIHVDNGWLGSVLLEARPELLIVDLSCLQCVNLQPKSTSCSAIKVLEYACSCHYLLSAALGQDDVSSL